MKVELTKYIQRQASETAQAQGSSPRKVLIVEDHELIVAGFRWAMQENPSALSSREIVFASSVEAAVQTLDERVNLVLLDMQLGTEDSEDPPLENFHKFRRQAPGTPVGIFSADESLTLLSEAIEGGAAGFIPKRTPLNIVLVAIELMLNGGVYVPSHLISTLRSNDSATADDTPLRALEGCALTARQRSVLNLVLSGESNKEIATRLGIGVGTVKNYVSSLLKLSQARTRGRLLALQRQQQKTARDI